MRREVTLKFVNGDADLQLRLRPNDLSVASLVTQVRLAKQWPLTRRIRLIGNGRELFEDEYLPSSGACVLHCIAVNAPSPTAKPVHLARDPGFRTTVDSPQADWMDTVDPSAVLMWVFGAILATVALFYICSAEAYNSTSLTMLGTMTVVYVVVFFPWFRAWTVPAFSPVLGQEQQQQLHLQQGLRFTEVAHDQIMGGGASLYGGHAGFERSSIPARPRAPISAAH